jgi:hypothetical protein
MRNFLCCYLVVKKTLALDKGIVWMRCVIFFICAYTSIIVNVNMIVFDRSYIKMECT